ncbi:hypothetical protein GCWU000282_02509 [Catonella morbi ATCC 51271]|uniref:Uncharacterized protein n=1 Tax=Catonella morbi ATCC 51271 TaxID=592026 RepID=V2XJM9_9FIRM|nr:hypothetical protein [Catonella morbi]ESL02374.1 hypothetical protein GCWU000282_02509 [Catonella morbi ATCC 51271]
MQKNTGKESGTSLSLNGDGYGAFLMYKIRRRLEITKEEKQA